MKKNNILFALLFCLFGQMLSAQEPIYVTYTCYYTIGDEVIDVVTTVDTFEVQSFNYVEKRYSYSSPESGNRILHTGNTNSNIPGRWEIRLQAGNAPAFYHESFEATPPCTSEGGWMVVPDSGTCDELNNVSNGCSQPLLPPNTVAGDAIDLPYQELCETPTVGTIYGAVPIYTPYCSAISCDNAYGVWYEFRVPGIDGNVRNTTVSVVSDANVAYALELRTVPHGGSANTVDCVADTSGEGVVNLSAALPTTSANGNGIRYFVRVYPRDCVVPAEADAGFSICVSELPSVTVPDAVGACLNADASLNSVGDNRWKYLTKDGEVLFGLLDSEALGTVSGSFYNEDLTPPRVNDDNQPVLNRNFTVTPDNQPVNPVRVRLFISKDEYDNFVQNTNAAGLNDLIVYRHSDIDVCVDQAPTGGVLENLLAFGQVSTTAYYLEFEIAGFSAFFVSESSSVLPVEWQSFTAKRDAKTQVVLHWTTAIEQNNAYFEIERSGENNVWETVGRKEAIGDSEQATNYDFTDTNAPSAALKYRLRQVDTDGTANYSKVISVAATDIAVQVKLFPNPAREEVFISGKSNEVLTLFLFDMYGKTVRSYRLSAEQASIAVDNIPAGVYLLRAQAENGTARWTQRLVVVD